MTKASELASMIGVIWIVKLAFRMDLNGVGLDVMRAHVDLVPACCQSTLRTRCSRRHALNSCSLNFRPAGVASLYQLMTILLFLLKVGLARSSH